MSQKNFLIKFPQLIHNIYIEVPDLTGVYITQPFCLFTREHFLYFCYQSLENLMLSCGYEYVHGFTDFGTERLDTAGCPLLISVWKKRETKTPKPMHIACSAELMLDSYIQRSYEKKEEIVRKIAAIPKTRPLAVWGCGLHTFRLLEWTDLAAHNVVKCYDFSIIKQKTLQGKFFAPVEPFAPDRAKADNIEAVIISSCRSQEEIRRTLEESPLSIEIISFY